MAEKTLSVLSGGKKYGPLAREDVGKLLGAGRLATSDLVAALDGPWMRLEDFLGVAPRREPPVRAVSKPAPKLVPVYAVDEPIPEVETPVIIEGPLSDSWQVRVRKMPSACLSAMNLQQLLDAREITFDSLVNHETWNDTDWRPLRTVPQLSKKLVPPPNKG